MEWTLIPLGFLLLFFLIRRNRGSASRRALMARDEKVVAALQPVYDALEANQAPDQAVVNELASRVEIRAMLYRLLEQAGLAYLFPEELVTHEAAAASDLAFYLLHPAELGEVVEELTYLGPIEQGWERLSTPMLLVYHLFTFRHKSGETVAGVAGPVIDDDPPYAPSRCTMSYYDPIDSMTHIEHVAKVHDAQWPGVAQRLFGAT
ncbi:MAG: hypothetical protein AAFQ98_16600 [Bacteroidota bacterium]